MNARVVVAAGIDNELTQEDYQRIKDLKNLGYDIYYIYYIPRIPAEMTALESVNEDIIHWTEHALQKFKQDVERLGIPENKRLFVTEILGERQVRSVSKKIKAEAILTHYPENIRSFFENLVTANVPVLDFQTFASQAKEQPIEASTYRRIKELGESDEFEKVPELAEEEAPTLADISRRTEEKTTGPQPEEEKEKEIKPKGPGSRI